ncbi:MAG: type II toxin-antitoxin system RelE/ParE family toxin, partial [Mariprofundaceae bacterium]|nr:type II toxin-antitoxin system RelE/ParE family toxin [Mariprofundaceae bacterium]
DIQSGVYMNQLKTRFFWLYENPQLGKQRQELAPALFSFPEGNHVIFYRVNEGMLEVARVLHKEMDVEQQFIEKNA